MKTFKVISFRSDISNYNSGSMNIDDQKSIIEMTELFKKMTKKYCSIHDYLFKFNDITESDLQPILDIKRKYEFLTYSKGQSDKWNDCILYKLFMIKDELNKDESKYIAFFDSDLFVSNPSISLDSFIDDVHEIFVSQANNRFDFPQILNKLINDINALVKDKNSIEQLIVNRNIALTTILKQKGIDFLKDIKDLLFNVTAFNAGLFIVKNTDLMKQLFDFLCCHFYLVNLNDTQFADDEFLISRFISSPAIKDKVKYLPLSMVGNIFGLGEFRYDIDRSFAQHNYAVVSISDRLKCALELSKNKWWRSVNE